MWNWGGYDKKCQWGGDGSAPHVIRDARPILASPLPASALWLEGENILFADLIVKCNFPTGLKEWRKQTLSALSKLLQHVYWYDMVLCLHFSLRWSEETHSDNDQMNNLDKPGAVQLITTIRTLENWDWLRPSMMIIMITNMMILIIMMQMISSDLPFTVTPRSRLSVPTQAVVVLAAGQNNK